MRDIMLRQNAMELQSKINDVVKKIHEAGGCDAGDGYSKGWDDAITEVLNIISVELGIELEEM